VQNLTLIPFNLPGKVYRAPMPFGKFDYGKTTLHEMQSLQILEVITLVEEFEWHEKAGCDLREKYQLSGITMEHMPVVDFNAPQDPAPYRKSILKALDFAKNGRNISVHCNAGLGRTGTFLAVMAIEHFGWSPLDAILWIRQFIPGAVENETQFSFVMNWESRKNL